MSSTPDIDRVRAQIFADHARLRAMTKRLAASALETLCDETCLWWVRAGLAELKDALERHLEYEEASLVPLLTSADAWGSVRVEQLERDHSGQRAVLAALIEDAGDGGRRVDELVEEVQWFVRSLEKDMFEEEATLLSTEALGGELPPSDQVDG